MLPYHGNKGSGSPDSAFWGGIGGINTFHVGIKKFKNPKIQLLFRCSQYPRFRPIIDLNAHTHLLFYCGHLTNKKKVKNMSQIIEIRTDLIDRFDLDEKEAELIAKAILPLGGAENLEEFKQFIRNTISLINGKWIQIDVEGYKYGVKYKENFDWVDIEPYGDGDIVCSTTQPDDYRYTHGGPVYKAAQSLSWKYMEAIKEIRPILEKQ